ncbi:hypothetical protein N7495_010039 [Penicillium taxi]|uniref:uncharacterized protein n=1 Tax=Penicillium taxi TaxID=168475 RepID=UPI0025457987|nr:uncharacterized protein N7495_010039 [Penicillium taxi]KAJ5885529.1 hypothetical protein N7495_010039 [Penicillium taxi]
MLLWFFLSLLMVVSTLAAPKNPIKRSSVLDKMILDGFSDEQKTQVEDAFRDMMTLANAVIEGARETETTKKAAFKSIYLKYFPESEYEVVITIFNKITGGAETQYTGNTILENVEINSESASNYGFICKDAKPPEGSMATLEAFMADFLDGSGSQIVICSGAFRFGGIGKGYNKDTKAVTCDEFKDYHVPFHGEKKQLLNQVFGNVKPGSLVALMGASGAGKTTLLDVLAQRKDSGEIHGSILIDGKPQGVSFQRTTGYCEQQDVHESTATVQEALIFSAVLRQPSTVPYEEKIAYVDHIIDLLELTNIKDALIGNPGAGLSIEQRKRVTLGVELVAKPTLLFLDEPTSGLDGQSAFNIVRFLRKLVDGGQAVLCTIHQPSAVLFDAFDGLLLLAKGGRMTYFGETGKESTKILDYFSRNGTPCPADANPAEHIIDVIQGSTGNTDWVDVWSKSEERKLALTELQALDEAGRADQSYVVDTSDFATSHWFQFKMVTKRLSVQIWR